MTERLKVLEVLQRSEQYFRSAGIDTARLDAEVLLAHVLGIPRIQLYIGYERPLSAEELVVYRGLVRRRADREPVAYLTGIKEFHSLAFRVTPSVLIPRPETEHLVDSAVEICLDRIQPRLLDVGTGSGAIAVAWASCVADGTFVATDVSPEALLVASGNAERQGVADRGEFRVGDLYDPVRRGEVFDLIVSNPPYVGRDEEVDPECRWEPDAAVFCDGDPVELYRRLAAGAVSLLATDGRILMELPGAREDEIVAALPPDLDVARIVRDYQGLPRVLVAVRGPRGRI